MLFLHAVLSCHSHEYFKQLSWLISVMNLSSVIKSCSIHIKFSFIILCADVHWTVGILRQNHCLGKRLIRKRRTWAVVISRSLTCIFSYTYLVLCSLTRIIFLVPYFLKTGIIFLHVYYFVQLTIIIFLHILYFVQLN